ncbi:hypothetical protein N7492_001806 [Penicillium capsulatum]|uniref:Uncharacterized protein n=1 Tax=Penicillium capsulatum TaxID=69766 RepID=A0A9W9IT07_9EURO|nr:hypothetical protein N7492_001806 [Penicillium capsulatum]KAJ6129144.1 hypothetical protein N7512_001924 [Penicillium capsulatum]
MDRATGSATSRRVNNSSKRHRDVPFKEIEPKAMPFVFPPVTFYQNMLDRLPTEPTGAPIGHPHIDLGEVCSKAKFYRSAIAS